MTEKKPDTWQPIGCIAAKILADIEEKRRLEKEKQSKEKAA